MARWRRRRLARLIPEELRRQFDRDGYVVIRDALPPAEFEALRRALFAAEWDCRVHQQGDTLTRRVPFGAELRRRFPILADLLDAPKWRGLMAYVASTQARPLYYLQTIAAGAVDGPPDPQVELHSDTFHPSLKAWLFLTEVKDDERPLTYVARSHRLTPERVAWEQRRSVEVMASGDRLSQRGSFRIRPEELRQLHLPPPTRFAVPANTLVVADTCGFHARADASHATLRVELWAYSRRSPFLPWLGGGLLAWAPIADRRAALLYRLLDALNRCGLRKQHWTRGGARKLTDM